MTPAKILTWISVLTMFAVIGWFMNGIFMPDKIYAKHPAYTAEYVQRLEVQKIYYQKQAAWYERGWETITKLLEQ